MIATLKPGKPLRMAFGSCRTSVSHDATGNATHGVDALRSLALKMATDSSVRWPDLVLFLGDQVYADETTEAMQEFIRSRRDIEVAPGKELKDYEEYAHLYWLAWSDPLNRWLLSTLPSSMIFDDHDVRDDWNTSYAWKQEIEKTDWWHGRIVSGLGSYWIYQHIGNLSPEERRDDEMWQHVASHQDDDASSTSPSGSTARPSGSTRSRTASGGATRASSATSGSSWWTPGPRGCSSPTAATCSTRWSGSGSTSSCAATASTC